MKCYKKQFGFQGGNWTELEVLQLIHQMSNSCKKCMSLGNLRTLIEVIWYSKQSYSATKVGTIWNQRQFSNGVRFSNRKQFIEHEQKEIKLQTKLLVIKCGIP